MKTQTIKSDKLGGLQPLVIVTRHPAEVSGIKTFISQKSMKAGSKNELSSDVHGARYSVAS